MLCGTFVSYAGFSGYGLPELFSGRRKELYAGFAYSGNVSPR